MVDPDSIALTDVGEGEPLLCLHGIGSSSASFRGLADRLADRCRVIAWDAPGYGKSGDPDVPPGINGYADAAIGVLDLLGIADAHVLGVSWGGVIATRVALRHPSRVRSLTLADTSRGAGTSAARAAAMRRRPADLDELGAAEFARRRAPRLLAPDAPAEIVADVAAIMAAAVRLPGYGWAAESMAATDHESRLGELRVRTLVLVGAQDEVCPPEESRLLAAGIIGAQYAEIAAAGHLANLDQPDEFSRAMREFLAV